MRRHIGYALLALFAATTVIEATDTFVTTGGFGFARPAEAIVGRPLTPVSVAGVARRTVRQCAVTVVVC